MPEPKKPTKNGTVATAEPKRTVPKKEKKKLLPEREVKYPCYKVLVCCNDVEGHVDDDGNPVEYDGPITVEIAKALLGWETEPDYVKRKLAEDPDLKESKLKFGNEFLLKDADGAKVICWNNCTNRPFNESHSESLAQDILTKNWQMNQEPIIIGVTGLVISGQHRLVGLVLAVEGKNGWRKQAHWQEIWETEPVLESLVAFGCSEDPKVIKTIDNVMPRSLSDVFYTSPLFADKTQSDKNELSKMLSFAVGLLWKRTRGDGDRFIEHQTHAASLDFLDRHQKLLACVKHIYDEDGGKPSDLNAEEIVGKAISNGLKIQRGHAAALMYLMAQSKTKEEVVETYYTAGNVPSEKKLDWSCWDAACQFWTELAEQKLEWAQTVKDALAMLTVSDDEDRVYINANAREKAAVLVTAWTKYRIKEKFNFKKPEELHPNFTIDEVKNTRRILPVDEPVTGGIDRGTLDDEEADTSALTKEQVEEEKDKARAEKIKETLDKNKQTEIRANADKKVVPTNAGKKIPANKDKPSSGGKPALRGGVSDEPF